MLIWQGAGILAILIPTLFGALFQWSVDHYLGNGYSNSHHWQNAIAWCLGAAAVWLLGLRLAATPGKQLINPATGAIVELKNKHTLFWIPMHWWALVWLTAAAWPALTGLKYFF